MPKYEKATYRNCGYCRTSMSRWELSGHRDMFAMQPGGYHPQAVLSCPCCGRLTLVGHVITAKVGDGKVPIHDGDEVIEVAALPSADDLGVVVKHVPDDTR
ncbi:hypothetical protein AVP41_01516 [Microbacterium sp. TNHR37B]|nr:hypothetical protein AVP41_01516 [Microbacterium sp. TNHR37B]